MSEAVSLLHFVRTLPGQTLRPAPVSISARHSEDDAQRLWMMQEKRLVWPHLRAYSPKDIENTITDILSGSSWFSPRRSVSEGDNLRTGNREAVIVPGAGELAADLISRFHVPLAASPELRGLSLSELLKDPPTKIAFIPFTMTAVKAGMSIHHEQWAAAFMAAISGVGVTFILVAGAWVLQALAERPAWPDNSNEQ